MFDKGGPPKRRGVFFMQESFGLIESSLYLAPKFKQRNTMTQEELNKLHGLLTVFKEKMLPELDLMLEEEMHVVNACWIVAETKPNA